jgi:peptide deformylase
MTLRLLEYPQDSKLLRRVARQIRPEEFGDILSNFADMLVRLMMSRDGMGLSSTQVTGPVIAERPWRMFALRIDRTGVAVACNPCIVQQSKDAILGDEGCLSFASVVEKLTAPDWVKLEYQDVEGKACTHVFRDYHARCVFHECEHLDGKLIVDRMGTLKRKLFMREVGKARRETAECES